MDLLGAPILTKDFVVAGTCTPNLHGMCEAMYRPDMVSMCKRECLCVCEYLCVCILYITCIYS